MPLSWNEIRDRAIAFTREWAEETSEDAEAKSFWDGFFRVFGLERRRVAQFEAPVSLVRNRGETKTGKVDLFWKGRLLVEHKSRGKDLDRAYGQAVDYFEGIAERDLPRYVLVSDFARFRLDDLDKGERHEFALKDLPKQIRLFGFIAGYEARPVRAQDSINLRAAERMGKLHDRLKESGYEGHDLEVFLVRLLFCLFADDTGIFQPVQSLRDWIENRTAVDGSDLGAKLTLLFQVLNTPAERRQKTLDEDLAAFPYVNGKLFEERLSIPEFDAGLRTDLLEAAALDWSRISPAIFGALFQSVMDPKARRNLGAHYTSEENILKVIEPLFLDDLRAELTAAKGNASKLFELQKKLRALTFLDPACGCGNFLVVAYRELREIELEILLEINRVRRQAIDIVLATSVNVDQFYGIEIEEFPAQIAQVALWLTDHQMNQKVSDVSGRHFARLPLTTSATIVHGNALRIDWETVVPPARLRFVFGNPPFVGKTYQSTDQRADKLHVAGDIHNASDLDLVAAWIVKCLKLMSQTAPALRAAFVATNSLTQGEQAPLLWNWFFARGGRIDFAHRPFVWTNEAANAAAVHCVVIGFSISGALKRRLFEYEHGKGSPHELPATHINGYLVDAPHVPLRKQQKPICSAPRMGYGSKPTDGGNLLLDREERSQILQESPHAAPFIRRFVKNSEFISGEERYCLWLVDCPPAALRAMPSVLKRVAAVREFRSKSTAAPTVASAERPALFFYVNQPTSRFMLVPGISSEARRYIPMGFLDPSVVAGDNTWIIAEASEYHFGALESAMHMAWTRTVSGRIKSDFQYSASIVYNNFPWPESPTEKQREAIEEGARGVLAAREEFSGATLAELYDPLTMPPALVKAHQRLDKAVDAAYGYKGKPTDAERVAFLFELYQKYTSLFPTEREAKKRRKRT